MWLLIPLGTDWLSLTLNYSGNRLRLHKLHIRRCYRTALLDSMRQLLLAVAIAFPVNAEMSFYRSTFGDIDGAVALQIDDLVFTQYIVEKEDRRNYLYRRILIELRQKFQAEASLAPVEAIDAYYQSNRSRYSQPEFISYSEYEFETMKGAVSVLGKLESPDSGVPILNIETRNPGELEGVIGHLIKVDVGEATPPLPRNGTYFI